MSINKYNPATGELELLAGQGKAEYGASTERKGDIVIPATTAGNFQSVSVVFAQAMPDNDYAVVIDEGGNTWAHCSVNVTSKTATGFTLFFYNAAGQDAPQMTFKYRAFKLYTDTEYNNLLNNAVLTSDVTDTVTNGDMNPVTSNAVYEATKNGGATTKISTTRCKVPMRDFNPKTWSGLTRFRGDCVWTDGDNVYYSFDSTQHTLNKSTSTWTAKTWSGLTRFRGDCVWTDGNNIYYSSDSNQYVLDKSTSTWISKTWTGLTSFEGYFVWTDGNNIYYSSDSNQYVLDKSTSTWISKTWTGLTSFRGIFVWTDGNNIYYSDVDSYTLDKSTSKWTAKTWTGLTSFYGNYIWTDGNNIYYSDVDSYTLDKSTSKWTAKSWTGSPSLSGQNIWTDGNNIYFSDGSKQYILNKCLTKT